MLLTKGLACMLTIIFTSISFQVKMLKVIVKILKKYCDLLMMHLPLLALIITTVSLCLHHPKEWEQDDKISEYLSHTLDIFFASFLIRVVVLVWPRRNDRSIFKFGNIIIGSCLTRSAAFIGTLCFTTNFKNNNSALLMLV